MIPSCHQSLHFGGKVKKGAWTALRNSLLVDIATRSKGESTFHIPNHQVRLLSEGALAQPALRSIPQRRRF